MNHLCTPLRKPFPISNKQHFFCVATTDVGNKFYCLEYCIPAASKTHKCLIKDEIFTLPMILKSTK